MQVVVEHRRPPAVGAVGSSASVSLPPAGREVRALHPPAVLPEHTHALNTHTAGRSHKPRGPSVKLHTQEYHNTSKRGQGLAAPAPGLNRHI